MPTELPNHRSRGLVAVNFWRQPAVRLTFWVGLVLVALWLRGYRLTGWVLNYDESHWLLYALQPGLLLQSTGYSAARPDGLLAWIGCATTSWFGPNELAIRLAPVLCGSATVVLIAWFVARLTADDAAGRWAGIWLAICPLHVFKSSKALPDVIAVCLITAGLALWAGERSRVPARRSNLILCGGVLCLALFAKATTLAALAVALVVLGTLTDNRHTRRAMTWTIVLAIVPLVLVAAAIHAGGSTLAFVGESKVTATFGWEWSRLALQFDWLIRWLWPMLALAGIGGVVAWRRDRRWLVWVTALLLVVITPLFRAKPRELLYLIPFLWPLAAFGVQHLQPRWLGHGIAAIAAVVMLAQTLWGVTIPAISESVGDQRTGVLQRPPNWPSRDVVDWLGSQLRPDEGVLLSGLGFVDPLALSLKRLGIRYHGAASAWDLLRDPGNRIRYFILVDDPAVVGGRFYAFAQSRFTLLREPTFPGYTIFDCRSAGQFIAYPDATADASVYLRRGHVERHRGQIAAAIAAFQEAIRQEPTSVPAQKSLLACYLAVGDKSAAIETARAVLHLSPRDEETRLNLAILYVATHAWAEANRLCQQNIQEQIAPAISHGLLGQVAEAQGDLIRAAQFYETALQLDPTNTVTRELLRRLKNGPTTP